MMNLKILLLLLVSYYVRGQVTSGCDPTVTIKDVTYIGKYHTTAKNISFASFEGIPYAEPPIGNLRFKDPVPVGARKGTFNATEIGPICIQPNISATLSLIPTNVGVGDPVPVGARKGTFNATEIGPICIQPNISATLSLIPTNVGVGVIGSEDCLTLNIYVPFGRNRPKWGYPVICFIHGGGFTTGNPNQVNVELLQESGFIYVGCNHRLGPFGFLSLGTDDVPGNAGVKDQTTCLRWIQKNIKYFGGDAKNVLLAGVSSGAASVHLQQLSPMAKGLFSKIISISGSSLLDWTLQTRPADKAAQLAALLGLDKSDPLFLQKLQSTNAADILFASLLVQPFKPGALQDRAFVPVVEKEFKGKEAFLTQTPIEYINSGKYNQVPIIIGVASKEGAFYYNGDLALLTELISTPRAVMPLTWQNILTDDAIIRVYNEIILKFFKKLDFDLTNIDDFDSAIDLFGDVRISKPVEDSVRALAKSSREPVYHYVFSFTGVLDGFFVLPYGLIGGVHGIEVVYLSPLDNPRIGEFTPDGWTRRRFLKIYENFSKTSNPTPGNCTHLLPTKWKPATKTTEHYLEINGALTPSIDPAECRMAFWRDLELRVFSGMFN